MASEGDSLYTLILETLKQGPDAENQLFTFEEMFFWALKMMTQHQMCTCRLFEMVQVAADSISSQYTGDNGKWAIDKQILVGALIMEVVCRQMVSLGMTMTGQLERLVYRAVSLVAPWKSWVYQPGNTKPILTKLVRNLLVLVLQHPRLCPSVTLRVELLRFVSMYEVEDILDENLSFRATSGLLLTVLDMTVVHLLPKGRIGLLSPIRKILSHFCGAIGVLLQKCRENILQLVVGENERAAAHLVMLMGQAARRVMLLRRSGNLTNATTVEEFLNIVYILRMLVACPPNMKLFDEPGMCRIAAGAIGQTCHSIMQTWKGGRLSEVDFANLLIGVNNLFMVLAYFPLNGAVMEELRRYHSRCLSRLAANMKKFQVASCVPEPLETTKPDAPARFLDVISGRLMDVPVKHLATGMVIDRATLLTTLLAATVNPETGNPLRNMSYERMTDLEEEIRVWRGRHHQQEQQSSADE